MQPHAAAFFLVSGVPVMEWILVVSIAFPLVMFGMMEGMRLASMDLPVPNGPDISRIGHPEYGSPVVQKFCIAPVPIGGLLQNRVATVFMRQQELPVLGLYASPFDLRLWSSTNVDAS